MLLVTDEVSLTNEIKKLLRQNMTKFEMKIAKIWFSGMKGPAIRA